MWLPGEMLLRAQTIYSKFGPKIDIQMEYIQLLKFQTGDPTKYSYVLKTSNKLQYITATDEDGCLQCGTSL